MSVCLLLPFRVDHHSWRRECSTCSHRGSSKEGATRHQQCHADWRQKEVSVHAFNAKGNLIFANKRACIIKEVNAFLTYTLAPSSVLECNNKSEYKAGETII